MVKTTHPDPEQRKLRLLSGGRTYGNGSQRGLPMDAHERAHGADVEGHGRESHRSTSIDSEYPHSS